MHWTSRTVRIFFSSFDETVSVQTFFSCAHIVYSLRTTKRHCKTLHLWFAIIPATTKGILFFTRAG